MPAQRFLLAVAAGKYDLHILTVGPRRGNGLGALQEPCILYCLNLLKLHVASIPLPSRPPPKEPPLNGTLSVLALSTLVLLPGCRPKAEKTPVTPSPMAAGMDPHGAGPKKETVVVVPAFQEGKYKGIIVSVVEVASKKATLVEVPLNVDFAIPGTGLSIHVDNILTTFGMGEGIITSRSEKMTNPAAQIRVSESGAQVWKGWLFSLFPDAHAFEHAKYTLKLVDFIPVK